MLFSIIIPLYNKEKQVCEAVRSVLKQTYENFELIIVDDGSTDCGVDAIKTCTQDTRIEIVQQNNAGVSAARNTGIQHSKGDYICFLDADDLWMDNHLEVLKNLIGLYPDAGLYATRHKLIEVDGTERIVPMRTETMLLNNLFQDELDTGYNYLHTNSICIPNHVFKTCGYFKVGERTGEDTSLWLRIAAYYSVAIARPVTTIYRREFSDAYIGLELNPTWSFLEYSKELLRSDLIQDIKKASISRYVNRYRISLCRHALLAGDRDGARSYYSSVNWAMQGKREKIITDICSIVPSMLLKALYHKKYGNSFKPREEFEQ